MRAVSTRYNDQPAAASRPFDGGRDGFVLGEGAWMIVLEREDRARARGARVYATIDGYGSTCDAYHRVQMEPDGEQIVRAMSLRDRSLRTAARRDRIRQLSRHVDGAERRCRVALRAPAVRRSRRPRRRLVHQVDDRPSAGRQRRCRHRDHRARAAGAVPAADDQPGRRPIRTATSTSSPTRAAPVQVEAALCNCLGFGSKNSALVVGRAEAEARGARMQVPGCRCGGCGRSGCPTMPTC